MGWESDNTTKQDSSSPQHRIDKWSFTSIYLRTQSWSIKSSPSPLVLQFSYVSSPLIPPLTFIELAPIKTTPSFSTIYFNWLLLQLCFKMLLHMVHISQHISIVVYIGYYTPPTHVPPRRGTGDGILQLEYTPTTSTKANQYNFFLSGLLGLLHLKGGHSPYHQLWPLPGQK